MKLLITSIVFLFFISIVIITSDVSYEIESGNYVSTLKLVSNNSNKDIPLYAENTQTDQVITYLKPGQSLPFAYSGSTGDWNYVFLNSSVVLIRSKNVSYSYRVYDSITVPLSLINGAYWVGLSGSIISCLFLLGLIVVRLAVDEKEDAEEVLEEYKLDFNSHAAGNDSGKVGDISNKQQVEKKKIETHKNENIKEEKSKPEEKSESEARIKAEKLQKARLAEKLRRDKEEKRQKLIAVKKAKAKSESSVVESKLTGNEKQESARLRHELITMANSESDTRYRGQATIVEMKASYERLLDKYQQIKAEASKSGAKFDASKYEDLLKSRAYQVCVVSSLIKDKMFTILEWCPGKGFESEITVASTINPNLVVQDTRGNVVGIECKYRSDYLLGEEKEICWASVDKAEQYKTFSKARNMPVFIAIGVKGKSKLPKYNFLVPLAEIDEKSRKQHLQDVGFALIVKYKPLGESYVKSGDYSNSLQAGIA